MKRSLSLKQKWNITIITGAVLITFFFVWFSNFLVSELSRDEITKVKSLAEAFNALNDPTIEDFTPYLKAIQENSTIKIIIVDENGHIKQTKNFTASESKDSIYLYNTLKEIKLFTEPIRIQINESDFQSVYYKEKDIITLLRFYPYIQLLLIGIFITVSYIGFSTSRKFEQNKVWVGMSKETAHQIGTPLSSLWAWIEFLRISEGTPDPSIMNEMEKDLDRLKVITERFSKIGSKPELELHSVPELLKTSVDYLKARISKKVSVHIEDSTPADAMSKVNQHLFSWVIENITKNAVDAMQGEGSISYYLKVLRNDMIIDIKDSGKGIPKNQFKTVFQPGFTTKKRGWGLGLSLAKRIIEEYHNGEIFVKDSDIGKGTTFRIIIALNIPEKSIIE